MPFGGIRRPIRFEHFGPPSLSRTTNKTVPSAEAKGMTDYCVQRYVPFLVTPPSCATLSTRINRISRDLIGLTASSTIICRQQRNSEISCKQSRNNRAYLARERQIHRTVCAVNFACNMEIRHRGQSSLNAAHKRREHMSDTTPGQCIIQLPFHSFPMTLG